VYRNAFGRQRGEFAGAREPVTRDAQDQLPLSSGSTFTAARIQGWMQHWNL
jgi:hypothetical protein